MTLEWKRNLTVSGMLGSLRLALFLLLFGWLVESPAFQVEDAVSRLQDGVFVVDANIDYEFSDIALEALENGVPLTVDIHFQVRRDGAWIWEKDIVEFHLRRQLRYLPLSSTYEMTDIDRKEIKLYFTRLAAIKAMGTISNVEVVSEDQLQKNLTYLMEIRSKLDIEALPVPLRPTAYMSSGWKLSSEWSQWRIRP